MVSSLINDRAAPASTVRPSATWTHGVADTGELLPEMVVDEDEPVADLPLPGRELREIPLGQSWPRRRRRWR